MPIDSALVGALHVEYLRKRDLGGNQRPHHTLFQTSTIDGLLEGNYDGDVTFTELEDRGDLGLGTLNALDGEMISGRSGRRGIRSDGRAFPIDRRARTPFAVVTAFEPAVSRPLATVTDFESFAAYVDGLVDGELSCYAVRVDGDFAFVKTRSVPRQRKPYPPLSTVVQNQPTFRLHDVRGSLVGFRFFTYTAS